MQDYVQDPDPVRQQVLQTVDALAVILGLTTDPARVDRTALGEHLATAARCIAAAQAANDRATRPSASTRRPLSAAGDT